MNEKDLEKIYNARLNHAVVFNCDRIDFEKVKELIEKLGARVIYEKHSYSKLIIKEVGVHD